jgi:hypothetical protein
MHRALAGRRRWARTSPSIKSLQEGIRLAIELRQKTIQRDEEQ